MKGGLMLRFWGEWRMTVSGYKDPTWGDENTLKTSNSGAVQVDNERKTC